MRIGDFLNQLDGIKTQGDGWVARCPAHEDRRASLSITEGEDGRILVRCHAGCSAEAVVSSIGLALSDLFAGPKPRRGRSQFETEAAYDYKDEAGRLLYQVVRQIPKKFIQRKPDGAGGWIYNLNGVRRVPYRLPALLAACRGKNYQPWIAIARRVAKFAERRAR